MLVGVEHTLINRELCKIELLIMPNMHTEKDKLTGQETLAYKGKREVDKLDNKWFELFGGRSFPTQHSFSFLSSGKCNHLLFVYKVLLCLHFLSHIFNISFCLNLGYFQCLEKKIYGRLEIEFHYIVIFLI